MSVPHTKDRGWLWLLTLVVLHVIATCRFLPPTELLVEQPLLQVDYPVHTHRVAMYRQGLREGGLPWGYDPAVGAGLVVSPYRDIGAKPLQVLGLTLPGIGAGAVVRIFIFATALLFPLSSLASAALLKLDRNCTFWITASSAAVLWLSWTIQLYLQWGLVSFVASAGFVSVVLSLFIRFCRDARARTYWLFTGALGFLLLLHIQGPWSIALPLVILVLSVKTLPWRWKAAAVLAPAVAILLNAFWLLPAYQGSKMPFEPLDPMAEYPEVKHLTLTALSELTAEVDPFWIASRLLVLVLVVSGLIALWRSYGPLPAWSFGLAALWAFCLSSLGSFMPFFDRYQPVRFVVPAPALLAVPVGAGIASALRRLPVDSNWFKGTGMLLAIALSLWSHRGPHPLPVPTRPDALEDFIATNIGVDDRLAIQSKDGIDEGGFEARAMALAYDREVIGCTYPKVAAPAQFLADRILGKRLSEWSAPDLRSALQRWGISWVFTQTPQAQALLARTVDDIGTVVGAYRAFPVPNARGRFLIGSGTIRSHVNRLELDNLTPEGGLVVLRYRFHPAWTSEPKIHLEPFPVPEDRAGFIALRDPPVSLVLRFDGRAMLTAQWPTPAS